LHIYAGNRRSSYLKSAPQQGMFMEIPLQRQIGYASGNLGKSLLWTSLDYFLLFYMTEVAGIPSAWAGGIILVTLLWDASISPFIGYWIDRRAARGLDYRPFIRLAPVATALAFVGLFWLPSHAPKLNAAYLFIALMIFRSAYALLDVPHNALLTQMPLGSKMRMRLAGMRFFFSSFGGLVIATLVAPQFSAINHTSIGSSLIAMAVIAGAILCVTVWQSLQPAKQAITERGTSVATVNPRRFLASILGNRTAMLYLVMAAVFAVSTPLYAKLLPYLLQYVRQEPAVLPTLLVALTVGQMGAMPIWTALLERAPPRILGLYTLTGLASSLAAQFWLVESAIHFLILASFVIGFFLGGTIQIIWGLSGEVADCIVQDSGIRVDAGLLAFLTFVQKAAIGVGAIVAGMSLELAGFKSGALQSASVLAMIETLAVLFPFVGVCATAGIFVILSKHLNQK
jgi:glycoside/pentoside/hexuronide:cation symporter, GPH family